MLDWPDFDLAQVLVKVTPSTLVTGSHKTAAWTSQANLNDLLAAQGITQLEPVFPKAKVQEFQYVWLTIPQA